MKPYAKFSITLLVSCVMLVGCAALFGTSSTTKTTPTKDETGKVTGYDITDPALGKLHVDQPPEAGKPIEAKLPNGQTITYTPPVPTPATSPWDVIVGVLGSVVAGITGQPALAYGIGIAGQLVANKFKPKDAVA